MSRLAKNIAFNLIGQGLLLVLSFAAVRYVFAGLGAEALGIIYFTATMSAVLCAALELGICATTVKEVAAHAENDPAYVRSLVRTASLFYWGAYAVLAVAVVCAAPWLIEKWIHTQSLDAASATRALRVLGVAALLALPRSLCVSLLRGLQRMEFINLIDVGTNGLQQLGMVIILASGGGLFAAVNWLALCFVLGLLAYLLVCARFFSFRALLPGFFPAVVRHNLGFAGGMTAISILSIVHMQADKLIVSRLLPLGVLGVYAFAFGLVSRANLLSGAIAQAGFPAFSARSQAQEQRNCLAQYSSLQDLVCLGTVPVYAAIIFAEGPLFSFLLDPAAARVLFLPVVLLCLGFYMNGTLQVPYVASLAVGKPQITVRLNLYALFIILPATALLTYRFGLAGAASGWVGYHLFAYAYAIPQICAQCLGLRATAWYRQVFRTLALAAGTYGVAWGVLAILGAQSIVALAAAYLLATLAFLAGAFALLGSDLRAVCRKSLESLGLRIVEAR